MLEAFPLLLPASGFLRLEDLGGKGALDQQSYFSQTAETSSGQNLHAEIAESSCFGGTGQHGPSGCVCRELVQQAILGSATDDANLGNLFRDKPLQVANHQTVFESQALEHRPDVRAWRFGPGLLRLVIKFVN